MMSKYLITGLAGTGKSTQVRILNSRGYTAIDLDNHDIGEWVDKKTGQVVINRPPGRFLDKYEWKWNQAMLDKLLQSPDSPTFFFGIAANQSLFYKHFVKIFCLDLDDKNLVYRLTHRQGGTGFGGNPGELEEIMRWRTDFYKGLPAIIVHIDASKKPDQIADTIIRLAHAN